MARKIIFTILFLFLSGCCSNIFETTEQVKIKVDTIKIASPIIQDTLKNISVSDSLVEAYKIKSNDTIVVVKYYPYEKKFYVKAKPDTVKIIKFDTLTILKTNTIYKNDNYFNAWDYLIALGIIILVIIIFIKIK